MSLEEYDKLITDLQRVQQMNAPRRRKSPSSAPKRKGKKDPNMARALKKANAKARKKNGSFKKGYDQARVMRMAHQIRRRGL